MVRYKSALVLFTPYVGHGWFSRLEAKIFKWHVSVLITYEGRASTFVEYADYMGTAVRPNVDTPDTIRMLEYAAHDGKIVNVIPVPVADRHFRRIWLEPMTCVSMVKSIIGMNDHLVFTPRQLYRRLMKWEHRA